MRLATLIAALLLPARIAIAQEPDIGLTAAPELVESGLMQHILPRFSLKTSVRVGLMDGGAMELASGPPGQPVFSGHGNIYHLRIDGSSEAARFADWLTSDIGRRAIDGFEPDSGPAYSATMEGVAASAPTEATGNTLRGEALALTLCGRCHVVNEQNRMNGLGSTPSFAVLRTLPEWDTRFQTFFVLNPHGAFTQIEGITQPFDPLRPSPIAPLELTVDDLDAIIAFVTALEPADLGSALVHQ